MADFLLQTLIIFVRFVKMFCKFDNLLDFTNSLNMKLFTYILIMTKHGAVETQLSSCHITFSGSPVKLTWCSSCGWQSLGTGPEQERWPGHHSQRAPAGSCHTLCWLLRPPSSVAHPEPPPSCQLTHTWNRQTGKSPTLIKEKWIEQKSVTRSPLSNTVKLFCLKILFAPSHLN